MQRAFDLRISLLVIALVPVALAVTACSDDDSPAIADASTDAQGSTADAPTEPASDAGVDAALARGQGTAVEHVSTAQSCDAICGAKKYTCGGRACEAFSGELGAATYAGGTSTPVAACATVPPTSSAGAALLRVDCCCITPFVLVTGPSTPASCATLCAAKQLTCDSQHDWGAAGKAGGNAQYERPSTTAIVERVFGCTTVPSKEIALTKPTEQARLQQYRCACVAP